MPGRFFAQVQGSATCIRFCQPLRMSVFVLKMLGRPSFRYNGARINTPLMPSQSNGKKGHRYGTPNDFVVARSTIRPMMPRINPIHPPSDVTMIKMKRTKRLAVDSSCEDVANCATMAEPMKTSTSGETRFIETANGPKTRPATIPVAVASAVGVLITARSKRSTASCAKRN